MIGSVDKLWGGEGVERTYVDRPGSECSKKGKQQQVQDGKAGKRGVAAATRQSKWRRDMTHKNCI